MSRMPPHCPICGDGMSRSDAGSVLSCLRDAAADTERDYEPNCTLCGEGCTVEKMNIIVKKFAKVVL